MYAQCRRLLNAHVLACGLLALPLLTCAPVRAHGRAAHTACPVGAFDYGDGMVAAILPADVAAALAQARQMAVQAAEADLSPFLREVPWHPHVSVIYGVTPERATPAQYALRQYLKGHGGASLGFGAVTYFDDTRGNKTAVVVAVHEQQHLLAPLHEALAMRCHIASRFAYNPHVTLTYLEAGRRLPAPAEEAINTLLAAQHGSVDTFVLTNRCGQAIDTVRATAQ